MEDYLKVYLLHFYLKHQSKVIIRLQILKVPQNRVPIKIKADIIVGSIRIDLEKDGRNLYVAPIRGKGLWDAIWAYVSIDEDMIIRGIYFDHKAETPGLGANIKQRFFMDDFIGESLLDNEGNFKGVTVSKTNLDPKNEDKYDNEVDAIAGSTITGDGVTAMIRSDLSLYQPYFNSLNNN